jgi:hypothetical protein
MTDSAAWFSGGGLNLKLLGGSATDISAVANR